MRPGPDPGEWQVTPAALAAGTAAQAALPPGTFPLERLQVIVPALAAADPLRLQFDPPAVAAAGRAIIAGLVDCLPPARPGSQQAPARAAGQQAPSGIPARLWARLWPDDPPSGLLDALRAALVLLADHELAASTLAARVAASVRADPYAVVATGLGAVGGAWHGGASLAAETMLAAAQDAAGVPRVVGDLLRRGERVPGFGHFVYRGGDPRAGLLLALVRSAVPASPRLAVVDAVLAETHRRALPEPNIDFALAVLASCAARMIRGPVRSVFAVARTAGWLVHALGGVRRPGRPLRPRALSTLALPIGARPTPAAANDSGKPSHDRRSVAHARCARIRGREVRGDTGQTCGMTRREAISGKSVGRPSSGWARPSRPRHHVRRPPPRRRGDRDLRGVRHPAFVFADGDDEVRLETEPGRLHLRAAVRPAPGGTPAATKRSWSSPAAARRASWSTWRACGRRVAPGPAA